MTGLVALFMLAHFSHHLINALLQPLLPFIRDDFGIDYTQTGFIFAAFTLAYGVSQIPAGWLADRVGPRILLLIGTVGVAVSGLLVGLSPTYAVMLVFLGVLGILGGSYHPAATPLVSAAVEEKKRGRALAFHQIGGTVSFFLTPLIAVGLASALGGWRGSFILLSLLTIVFGMVFYILLGRYKNLFSLAKGQPNEEMPASGSSRRLVIFIILGVVLQVAVFSTYSFIQLYAIDQFGTSEWIGAVLLSFVHFAGLFAGLVGGYISDRFGKVPVMVVVSLLAGPAIYTLSLVSISPAISSNILALLFSPIGLLTLFIGTLMYIGMPVTESYIITHSPPHRRSTVLGIYYFASRGGPGLVTPVIGYLIDKYDFSTAFSAVGLATLAIMVAASLFLWGSREQVSSQRPVIY